MIDLIIGFIEIGVGVMLIEFNYMFNLGISLLILGGFYIGKRILSREGKIVMSEEERKAIEYFEKCQDKHYAFKNRTDLKDREYSKIILKLIETQNKMIELMGRSLLVKEIGTSHCGYDREYICDKSNNDYRDIKCFECIIEYFRNQAKESENE